jgi:hypothetical protein
MSFPEIMHNAREDLTATIEGNFSPHDWHEILKTARVSLETQLAKGHSELESWKEVIRQFHKEKYWGHTPDYVKPKRQRKPMSLGMKFIIMTVNSMVFFKVLVLWFGQVYSRSENLWDKWIFFLIMIAVIFNYAIFLWRHRNHVD